MFLRCECGKIHVTAYIGLLTECTCGARLFPLAYPRMYRDRRNHGRH